MPVSQTDGIDTGLAVYVHWPFCRSKCPYCDFNSHVRDTVDQSRWRDALLRELDYTANALGPRNVRSIFFGGGTPSLMPPQTVAAIIDRVAQHWPAQNNVEITLEANPTSVEAGRLRDFRSAGVNRVSLGVQALNDAQLRFLGRAHSANEAIAAVDLARNIFPRMSFDLIYARPGQTAAQWHSELRAAFNMAADHLSLYQLTIEPGTGFAGAVKRGAFLPLDEETSAELYELTQALSDAAGMPAYEISNHARPGGESRHNLVYWRYGEYAGIGPGAHGRLHGAGKITATANLRKPEAWLDAVETRGLGRESTEALGPRDQAVEMAMMGLRLSEGISLARYASLAGAPLPADVVDQLCRQHYLHSDGQRIYATAQGRLLLNSMLARLLD